MFSKTLAWALAPFGHPADAQAASATETQSIRFDFHDLNLDRPSEAFEALRRIAAESPVIHGEAPEFHRTR